MWKYYFILIYFLIFQFSENNVSSFNVETKHSTLFRGRVNSMFGYSVAVYRDQNGKGWVIVGAPNNGTDENGVGGAVARCDITSDQLCYDIKFDRNGTKYIRAKSPTKNIEPIENKASQWLGAMLSTSMNDGGPIVACAPKYHWFGYIKVSQSPAGLKDAVGACWLTTMNGDPIEFSPCRNNDTAGHHRQGTCQAGFSASVTKDGKRLFIGAPGSWYWQGQLFTVDTNTRLPYLPPKNTQATNQNDTKANLLATNEGPPFEDNNYLGYSVAVGDFLGDGDSGAAVGVPRGFDLNGKVLLYTSQLHNHQNISGSQMGAYFGYALAVNDIDGDLTDDLIITAPFYTQPELAGVKIETGRIYVFYQGKGVQKFTKFDTRDGDFNRGQFGLSVSSLGDIDRDGFGDFAVGEPYGGPENRGAVYIYRGTERGVEEKPSQVIYSEDILEQSVRTFGWSIGGGLDLDDNSYPDMVVGAYETDTAIFFRSRPVVTVVSNIQYDTKLINLNNKACVLSDGTAVACSEIKVCCRYSGEGTWPTHNFVIHITLDEKKKKNPRMFFLDSESRSTLNSSIKIQKNQIWCKPYKVYVTELLRDKLTSLDAEMQVELANDYRSSLAKKRNPKERLTPVLGPTSIKTKDSLSIQKNCGPDNICVPDLVMTVNKNVEKYLLGSTQRLELNVKIENRGEDAFESVFQLQLPAGIDYINWDSQSDSNRINIQCTAPKISNNNTLRCDVGNPLPGGEIARFKVILQPITYDGMKATYELDMNVSSTNPERQHTLRNNIANINLPLWTETFIAIESQSKPQVLDLNSVEYANIDPQLLNHELPYAPSVVHNYTVRNNGPSTVLNVTAKVFWNPAKAGHIHLYLLEQPEISKEKVYCESANADFLSIKDKMIQKRLENQNSRSKRQISRNNNFSSRYNKNRRSGSECNLGNEEECVYFQCYIGPLVKDEEINIAVRYLVNVSSVDRVNDKLKIFTQLSTEVTSQPFIGRPAEPVLSNSVTETLILPSTPVPQSNEIPLWVWILSAIAGITILLLLIVCLAKCGFFKRNRPSAGPEREPLNRS